jgi:hypothetical protein
MPAFRRWTPDYIAQTTRDSSVSVAVTPDGFVLVLRLRLPLVTLLRRADAIHRGPNGLLYFVEPFVEKMAIKDLLAKIELSQLSLQILHAFSDEYISHTGSLLPTVSERQSLFRRISLRGLAWRFRCYLRVHSAPA